MLQKDLTDAQLEEIFKKNPWWVAYHFTDWLLEHHLGWATSAIILWVVEQHPELNACPEPVDVPCSVPDDIMKLL